MASPAFRVGDTVVFVQLAFPPRLGAKMVQLSLESCMDPIAVALPVSNVTVAKEAPEPILRACTRNDDAVQPWGTMIRLPGTLLPPAENTPIGGA